MTGQHSQNATQVVGQVIGTVVGMVFQLALPIVLLVFLNRSSITVQFEPPSDHATRI